MQKAFQRFSFEGLSAYLQTIPDEKFVHEIIGKCVILSIEQSIRSDREIENLATIEDVARIAGVSRMTVSRVVNNSGYVGEDTREKVKKAIKDLDYKPNLLAKALVTKKQKTLAYVMVNISDPFHNVVKQGFESIAYHGSYTSIMCDVHSAQRQQDYLDSFLENRTGGVVFHHLAISGEQVKHLVSSGVHVVLMDNEFEIDSVPTIATDNYGGAKMAVNHLIERGHKRIACVHGILEPYESDKEVPYEDTFQFQIWQQRTKGFTDAMKEAGLVPAGYFQSNGRTDIAEEKSYQIADEILSRNEPITAIYCENDIIALTMLKRFQEKHIKVPEQIAIVGHDGLDMVKMLHPQITTIEQPRYEMGRRAAQLLIDQIENGGETKHIVLKPKLVIGETS